MTTPSEGAAMSDDVKHFREEAASARTGVNCGCECDAPECVEYREECAEHAAMCDRAADALELVERAKGVNPMSVRTHEGDSGWPPYSDIQPDPVFAATATDTRRALAARLVATALKLTERP
jgi:hypothetical protein